MLILAAMGSEMTTNAMPERNSDAAVGMPEAAFEALFREYFVPLCAFSQYHFGLDGDSAKDIVQACFLKLWEMRHAIDTGSSCGPGRTNRCRRGVGACACDDLAFAFAESGDLFDNLIMFFIGEGG